MRVSRWLRPLAFLALAVAPFALPGPGAADGFLAVSHLTTRERYEALSPVHQRMLVKAARHSRETGRPPTHSLCWAPGSSPDVPELFQEAISDGGRIMPFYLVGVTWPTTASDAGPLVRGDPLTFTWSIVPDGLSIPGAAGELTSPSNLVAFLDSIYGGGGPGPDYSGRPWFPVFQQIFTVWGNLIGADYVYEPNDDGAAFAADASNGAVGVRGDLRIAGHFIDGQAGSNILAYNFFPTSPTLGYAGDMVIDTSNTTFYGDTSVGSIRLRNVLAHEHGHGLGIAHVCSSDRDFLMEPFVNLGFDGPQEDDVLAANRLYGDRDEFPVGNETAATATNVGSLVHGSVHTRFVQSIDGTNDEDWYVFTVPASSQVTCTVTPNGTTYRNGAQLGSGACPAAGTEPLLNALAQRNLALEVRGDSGGALLLAAADVNGAGGAEALTDVPLVLGAGTYYARVTGSDGVNAAQMYTLGVTVEAATIPSVLCPADPTVECSAPTLLSFDVTDPTGSVVDVAFTVDGVPQGNASLPAGGPPNAGTVSFSFAYPAGVHTVRATATNGSGGVGYCELTVTSADSTPPVVNLALGKTMLWLPANGLIDAQLSATVQEACDGAPTRTVAVYSDEPVGAAPYAPDATFGGGLLRLRAERITSAGANGRVYLVVVTATDASGNVTTACRAAIVPVNLTATHLAALRADAAAQEAAFKVSGVPAGWATILAPTPLP